MAKRIIVLAAWGSTRFAPWERGVRHEVRSKPLRPPARFPAGVSCERCLLIIQPWAGGPFAEPRSSVVGRFSGEWGRCHMQMDWIKNPIAPRACSLSSRLNIRWVVRQDKALSELTVVAQTQDFFQPRRCDIQLTVPVVRSGGNGCKAQISAGGIAGEQGVGGEDCADPRQP